jgi:hypothetical protein
VSSTVCLLILDLQLACEKLELRYPEDGSGSGSPSAWSPQYLVEVCCPGWARFRSSFVGPLWAGWNRSCLCVAVWGLRSLLSGGLCVACRLLLVVPARDLLCGRLGFRGSISLSVCRAVTGPLGRVLRGGTVGCRLRVSCLPRGGCSFRCLVCQLVALYSLVTRDPVGCHLCASVSQRAGCVCGGLGLRLSWFCFHSSEGVRLVVRVCYCSGGAAPWGACPLRVDGLSMCVLGSHAEEGRGTLPWLKSAMVRGHGNSQIGRCLEQYIGVVPGLKGPGPEGHAYSLQGY